MNIFITGTAGFIGFHLARRFLASGHSVFGYDVHTPFYDVRLKLAREKILRQNDRFYTSKAMLEDLGALKAAVEFAQPEIVIHVAAQAGVRHSLESPRSFLDANLVGTFNIMEIARIFKPRHLLLASSSSVYGSNAEKPFTELSRTDNPLSFYAATKKAAEVMVHSYSHLWSIPVTAFRFFTVYGPWGRPDMAVFKFVEAIENDQPIEIYNNGNLSRDFTFIDDLVEAVVRLVGCVPSIGADASVSSVAPFRPVNIGRGEPINLLDFIETIENKLGKTAIRKYLPIQAGDVPITYADTGLLQRLTGYKPDTSLATGVSEFVDWYRKYREGELYSQAQHPRD